MKKLVIVISLLIIFTGCSFETKGSIIPKYESPKTVLLVLDMQEDFLVRISGKAIFSKKEPDAFSNPEFEKYLAENQLNQLVITGVYADQCVLYTTLGALNRKYQVKFVRNGVGSSSEKAVNKACETVKKRGAEVIEYQPNIRITEGT